MGTVVDHKYLMAGVPFHVITRVTGRDQTPNGGQRLRLEFDGPLKGWQTWDYNPDGNNTTVVTAEFDYNVPGSAAGKFADELIIERLQERARHQTLGNRKLLVEAGSR